MIFKFKLDGSRLVPIKQELAEAPLSGEFLEKKVRTMFIFLSIFMFLTILICLTIFIFLIIFSIRL